ncbi:GTP cyclohydrolase II [Arthrobacter crusticola]|uniref:GTP cyclohydrolase-2 n=1 Tax=Arthrobacter crusticola TaxID=2547960 RepID=A0A4R5U255_9MICC|nr:GTP cyclohydrolase II [Arthrobacter crusticola]TDK27716.1 GTP cyclohydrolase II [Arthrobacter crusticola]
MAFSFDPLLIPSTVERVTETVLPTRHGLFRMVGYRDAENTEHVALVRGIDDVTTATGEPLPAGAAPLVRVHSECLTGDAFGSFRCDCGEQLDAALAAISDEGRGVVVYVRGHEGRGIGLLAKLKAYALQDQGVDTVDANTSLGLPVDSRSYHQAAEILQDLGVDRIRLLSGNPAKQEALEDLGISVAERLNLAVPDRAENAAYLATKRLRMRHDPAPASDTWGELVSGRVPAAPLTGEPEDLVHRYGYLAAADGPVVLAQLRQSLDGFIASRSGDGTVADAREDRTHLHRLRALVDAVVIGAGAVAADDSQLTVRDVPGTNPTRVVLDPTARVGAGSRILTDGAAPTLWLVGPDAQVPDEVAAHVRILRLQPQQFEPVELLKLLRGQGLDRVLVEGGGRTVSAFLAAGALDRLYLTTAPLLVGDGVPGVRFEGSDALAEARTAPVRRFVFGQDICTEFNFAAARDQAGATVRS